MKNQYKNDKERNYNRLNLIISEKIFDIYEYLGFNMRKEREDVFKKIKQLKRNTRQRNHQNTYVPIKENIKKRLAYYIKRMLRKIERREN